MGLSKKAKQNLSLKEAELAKVKELNDLEEKELKRRAEILRQKQELDEAENGVEETPAEDDADAMPAGSPGIFGFEDPKLEEVLSSLNQDGGSFFVYQIKDNGQEPQIGRYPLSDWPDRLENIARKKGGGSFRVRFMTSRGKQATVRVFSFDEDTYRETFSPVSEDKSMAPLVAMQKMQMEAMEQSRRDMIDLMKVVAGHPADNGLKLNDLATLLPLMKGGATGDPTAALMKGLELGLSLQGKTGEEGGIGELVTPLMALLSKVPTPKPTPAASMPKPLTDNPPAPTPELIGARPMGGIKESFFYRLYVPKILAAARAKEDAGLWAEKILNTIPESYDGILQDLIASPEFVEYLATFEPEALEHREWLEQVKKALQESFSDEKAAETAPKTAEA